MTPRFAHLLLCALPLAGCMLDPADDAVAPLGDAPAELTGANVELHTWYSPSRGDYFTTTDPAWVGSPGATRAPDYRFVRVEGHVLGAAFPQDGTTPLYHWWHPTRGDNFLTTSSAWAGAVGTVRSGYTLFRIEGHVYQRPLLDTIPLRLYWSGALEDNWTSADPDHSDWAPPPSYVGGGIQGYLLAPVDRDQDVTRDQLGWGTLRRNGVAATGARPLFTVAIGFTDAPLPSTACATTTALQFGASAPTIRGYFDEVSSRRFGWSDAGCVTHRAVDIAGTPADESLLAGSEMGGAESFAILQQALLAADTAGTDFARFDTNPRDGQVQVHELGIVAMFARSIVRARGISVYLPRSRVWIAGEAAHLNLTATFGQRAHEIMHLLVSTSDEYGSGAHSEGLTLMSATNGGAGDLRTWYLDPFLRVRLGWIEPRIVPRGMTGGQFPVDAVQVGIGDSSRAWTRRPVLFQGPSNREYYLAEFRNSAQGGYDANMFTWENQTDGFAVWQVKTGDDGFPITIPGILITPGTNGRIDATRAGDDVFQDSDNDGVVELVTPGPDRALQTVPAGDDRYWDDVLMFVRGGSNGQRGFSSLLQPQHGQRAYHGYGPVYLPFIMALRAGAPSLDGRRAYLEWGDALPRLDWGPATATRDVTFDVGGAFGTGQRGRVVSLYHKATGNRDVTVVAWEADRLRLRIPAASVGPGSYTLRIYGDATRAAASNGLALTVY